MDDAVHSAQPINWAVVSFLLEDAGWCDWLYREFDGQRIPRSLLGRPSRFGTPYPDRISVYPDPADPEQLENYAETLQIGQHLVVIVSPASGHSPVIDEHLKAFRASGGEERIIALVVKGEPASPSAAPGTPADEAWLPKWLVWRFQDNQFAAADSMEPFVIDARLGVASLSEARARLMAALLEIERARLSEFGAFKRSASNLQHLPSAVLASELQPPPTTVSFSSIAIEESTPTRHRRWPIFATAAAAVVALGCLAYWPDRSSKLPTTSAALFRPEPAESFAPSEPVIPPGESLVEARPLPERSPATAPNVLPSATVPTAPAPQVNQAPPPPAADPKRLELLTRRERLMTLGENRLASGDPADALKVFQDALVVFQELERHSDHNLHDVLALAAIHRRLGALSENLRPPAEARGHYEAARRLLADWRSKGALPPEASRLLAEVETTLQQGRKP